MAHKKKEVEAVTVTFQKGAATFLNIAICVYMLLIFGVLPFYNEEGHTHIGTDKSTFFTKVSLEIGKVAVVLLAAYLIFSAVVFVKKKGTWQQLTAFCRERISATDIFAALYGVCLLLSYACSDYKEDALWGATGWYMGLYTQLMLLAIYFLVAKCWKPKRWMTAFILLISSVVFSLGYLNRFDIDPLKMQVYGPSFISTIGNINWYCGYLVAVFFLGVVCLWLKREGSKGWQLFLWSGYVLIGFGTLITQGSSSGIVAAVVAFLVMFWLSIPNRSRMERFWWIMLLFGTACLITTGIQTFSGRKINMDDISVALFTNWDFAVFAAVLALVFWVMQLICKKKKVYFRRVWRVLGILTIGSAVMLAAGYVIALVANTLHPGALGRLSSNSLFFFTDTWGSNRGATWKAGFLCFQEQDLLHKLVGVGPDAMSAYLYKDGSVEVNRLVNFVFFGATLTNAHNEWLTVLVNTGILGCISFGGMMLTAIGRFIRRKEKNMYACACGFCLLAYTINNMFSFQQAMNASTIFLLLGMGEAYNRKK